MTSSLARSALAAGSRQAARQSRALGGLVLQTSTRAQITTASVDAGEVSHFDGLASSWWDPHGPSRLLHLMNPLRHRFISGCLASQLDAREQSETLRYLDIGCGGGIFAESAARLPNANMVTAVDPSAEVLAVARRHARRDPSLSGKLEYLNIGIEDLPLAKQSGSGLVHLDGAGYDVVTIFEVVEHVNDPFEFLTQAGRHVRPGGWLVLSTIARTWTSWLTTKLLAEDVLRIVPRGTHDWRKYLNEAELRQWFARQNGLWTQPRTMGVLYAPALGWIEVRGGEEWGNYFLGVRKALAGPGV